MGSSSGEAWRGAAVYSPLVLRYYDFFVLGQSNARIWRCPTENIEMMYDDCVTTRHCDIGVGSGYFLDKANWPGQPAVTLVDLNVNSLRAAGRRIVRFRPTMVRADVLGTLPDLPGAPFGSVGLSYLFHCIPGRFPDKATKVFSNVLPHARPGAVVFGATLLSGDVERRPPARALMWAYNKTKVFHNEEDDLEGLDQALKGAFVHHQLEVVGCVAMFRGTVGPV